MLADDSKQCTPFSTPPGHIILRYMTFGLPGAPSTLARLIYLGPSTLARIWETEERKTDTVTYLDGSLLFHNIIDETVEGFLSMPG